jgi:hypothetical protein
MTGSGRFSPLPTPRNSVFLTEWNGRFLAESCPSCLEPQTSILSPGKAGIRRVWRDNSFTLYLYLYPRGFSLPDSPFYGFFGPKIGLLEVPLICGFGKILPVVCLAYGTAQPHTPQSALYPPFGNSYGNPFEIGWTKMAVSIAGIRTQGWCTRSLDQIMLSSVPILF